MRLPTGGLPMSDRHGVGIGVAVDHLRAGYKVRRDGWNGEGMFLYAVSADRGERPHMREYVMLRTAQDDLVPWTCSQTDLLATDWELVE